MEYKPIYPRTGAESRFLYFVEQMLDYQAELERKHAYEKNVSEKAMLANEIMEVGEFLEMMKEYAFWKPELLEKEKS